MLVYSFPIIAALIGWFTNYLAIKMLFHPRKRTRILFFYIQGIFPKRQKALAEKLGQVVANELFSIEDVIANLKGDETNAAIREKVEEKIDEFLEKRLPEKMPMLGMFLTGDTKNLIKNTLLEEFETMLPEVIESLAEKLKGTVQVEQVVYEKVVNFSTDKLEQILYSIMKKEFRFIEILGAVLGFIIGCVQTAIVLIDRS